MIIDIPFDWLDVGYNTQMRKWMLEFYEPGGNMVSMHMIKSVEIYRGIGSQFAFKIPGGQPQLWHVRERYYKAEIESLEITSDSAVIKCSNPFKPYTVPENYGYVRYNYSLKANVAKVYFLDSDHRQIGEPCIRRYVLVDGLDHKAHDAHYPNIFLECSRNDISEIVITNSYVIISGTAGSSCVPAASTMSPAVSNEYEHRQPPKAVIKTHKK